MTANGGGCLIHASSLPGSQVIQLSDDARRSSTDTCFSGRHSHTNGTPTAINFFRHRSAASTIDLYSPSSSTKITVSCEPLISPEIIRSSVILAMHRLSFPQENDRYTLQPVLNRLRIRFFAASSTLTVLSNFFTGISSHHTSDRRYICVATALTPHSRAFALLGMFLYLPPRPLP